jgi:hypothetical protein
MVTFIKLVILYELEAAPHTRISLLHVGKQKNSTLQLFCTSYTNLLFEREMAAYKCGVHHEDTRTFVQRSTHWISV